MTQLLTPQPRPRLLAVNHWHDDNKGDAAITQSAIALANSVLGDVVGVATMHEEGSPASAGALRHLRTSMPNIRVGFSLAPTELAKGPVEVSRAQRALRALRWLGRLSPLVAMAAGGPVPRGLRDALADCDGVVVIGGSDIYDDPDVSGPLSLARLVSVITPLVGAQRLGKRTYLLGHTLGPFPRPMTRRLIARTLRATDAVVVREAQSLKLAQLLGSSRAVLAPDLAFSITPLMSPRVARLANTFGFSPGRSIVIVPRRHPHLGIRADTRLLDELARMGRALIETGACDGIVVVPQVHGPTPIEDDRPFARDLARRLSGVPTAIIEEDLAPAELAALYGETRLVVSVRLHGAILALTAGTPAFAIAYFTNKSRGVMAQVNLSDACVDFEDFSADHVLDLLPTLLAPRLREELRDAAELRRQSTTLVVANAIAEPA